MQNIVCPEKTFSSVTVTPTRIMTLFSCLPILFLVLMPLHSAEEADTPVTIEAAFSIVDRDGMENIYFFANGRFQHFKDGVNWGTFTYNSEVRFPDYVKAITLRNSSTVNIYGKNGGRVVTMKGSYPIRRFGYRGKGGPDAAGRRGDDRYFFYGCEMINVKNKKWVTGSVHTVGLPCDVDAAWAQGDAMEVLKGDQYWRLEADNSVNGPHPAESKYPLKNGWKYLPYVSPR